MHVVYLNSVMYANRVMHLRSTNDAQVWAFISVCLSLPGPLRYDHV